MDEREVDWSALPEELLRLINPARVDAVRFRSVCTSWRSSIPPPCDILPPGSLPLPSTRSARRAYVSHRTFYRFKLPDDVNPSPSTCSSKSWLVKVEEFEFGRKCLLNPLSNLRFVFPFPKVINLLDYQVVEVSKGHELQYASGMPIVGVNKLVLFPDSAWNSYVEDTPIFALYDDRKLGCVKYGDKNWTNVDDLDFDCDDIIVYKGKAYVVDTWGTVSWIDSSMKLIEFSLPLGLVGEQKRLMESCGELYVVAGIFDRERRFDHEPEIFPLRIFELAQELGRQKIIPFHVFKLDQKLGRWVRVKNLGDQVFFFGKDSSFSVSATDFSGCKGNCIYFTDKSKYRVFDLETGKIVDLQDRCHLFRPPASWLSS